MSGRHQHFDETRFQALLDGDFPPAEETRVRAEIEGCPRCSAEFEAWETLFEDLGDLPLLAPSTDFSERVLGHLPEAAPRGVGGRVREWVTRPSTEHLGDDLIQDLLDGRLAARTATRVESHLDACTLCREELEAHRAVHLALEGLPTLAPSAEFAERVMAGVRVRQMAEIAMAPVGTRERVAAWLREMVPSSRQRWAAAMGMLVTPVTLIALLLRSVFSNDLVTVGNLLAFARLRASDALGAAGDAVGSLLAEQSLLVAAVRLVGESGFGSQMIAASVTALLGLTLLAGWVLYRNVFASPVESSHARLSF